MFQPKLGYKNEAGSLIDSAYFHKIVKYLGKHVGSIFVEIKVMSYYSHIYLNVIGSYCNSKLLSF